MDSNPASGTNENGRWVDPSTEGGPMIQNRTLVEDQLKIAELRLYKNRKRKKSNLSRDESGDSRCHPLQG